MLNEDLLTQDFDDLFEATTEAFLAEAYTEDQARKALAKLKKSFPYKPLSAEWDKTEMIKASGQDLGAVKAYRKGYDKAVADFNNLVSPRNLAGENLRSFFTKESVKKAEAAAKAVKKLHPGVMKIEAKFGKGRKVAGKMKDAAMKGEAKKSAEHIIRKKKQAEWFEKAEARRKREAPKQAVRDNKRAIKQDFKKRVRQKVAKINFATGK